MKFSSQYLEAFMYQVLWKEDKEGPKSLGEFTKDVVKNKNP